MSTTTGLVHSEYRQTLGSKSDVSLSEHTGFNHWFWGSTVRRANNVTLQHTLRWNGIMSNFQHRPITEGCTGKTSQDEYLHRSDILGMVGWTVGGVEVSEVVGETVGEMVESALAEGLGMNLVRDEEGNRLASVEVCTGRKDELSKTGEGDELERMA